MEARSPPVPLEDDKSRRVVVLFRVLGWAWMALLVALTPASDPGADTVVLMAAAGLASAWTAVTLWVATDPLRLGSGGFVVADGVVALAIGAASTLAGAEELFHGAMPMSWIIVAGYAGGLRWAMGAGVALAAEQIALHTIDGRGMVPAAGNITFVVVALVTGLAFDTWRAKLDADQRLATSLQQEARQAERLDLANRLHDTVLQTLSAIRSVSHDSQQVRYLARRQDRELRSTIEHYRSPYDPSMRVALIAARDDIEDTYPVEVDLVIRDDGPLTPSGEAAVAAMSEALRNAATHSGVDTINVYATIGPTVEIFVRDRGAGFDTDDALGRGRGVHHSLTEPVERLGGTVDLTSSPGEGTEVHITLPTS